MSWDITTGDDVTASLRAALDLLAGLAAAPDEPVGAVSGAVSVDRIAVLERIRAATAAAQLREVTAFGRGQVEEQIAQVEAGRLDPTALGRGIGEQVGLACGISPAWGVRRVETARALRAELPVTFALLAQGRIGERVAELVVSQTRHLDAGLRALVDKQVVAAGLEGLSLRRAEALVKRFAYEADHDAYLARGRTARSDRRVGLRPAPDTMSVLSGFLPVEQGVACLAALRARTDSLVAAGDERSRDQIMADTLVERVTGQAAAVDVNVEVGIVMPLGSLVDPDAGGSAEIVGCGPVPAGIAGELLASTAGKRWWRRLFTSPVGGHLVGGDPRRRRFDGVLARLIEIRDQGWCRDPFCGAPIRHLDHVRGRRVGGPTAYVNGRGVCARGNYVREMPGWEVEVVEGGLGERPHTVRTTTPTGHTYTSTAGPAP